MNKKIVARIMLLLMFCFTVVMPAPVRAAEGDDDNTDTPLYSPSQSPQLVIGKDTKMQEAAPGDTINLVIPVQNLTRGRASKIVATLGVQDLDKTPFDLQQMSTSVSVPVIEGNAWENIRFDNMKISPQAKAQVYPLQINMTYQTDTGGSGSASATIYVKVIDGKDAPQLKYMGMQLENDKASVDAGEEDVITLKINNPSEFEVRDVKLQLAGFANEAVTLNQALDTWEDKKIPPKEFRFVPFKIRTNSELETGTYPLTLNMNFKDANGREYEVKDVKVYVPVEGGLAGKDKKATPRLIIDNFNYGGQHVAAGQPFGLSLNLRNTSKTKDLVNIKLSFSSDDNVFSPVGSSNTLFVDRINAGKSLGQSLRLRSKVDAESKTYNLNVEMEYEDIKGNKFTEKGMVGIDVSQQTKLTLGSINLPTNEIHVDEAFSITLDYFNTGRAPIRNLAVSLEGEGFNVKSRDSYIGNLEPGKSDYYDVSITPTKVGPLQGNIKVTYEDALGAKYQENRPFNLEVKEMEQMPPDDPTMGGMVPPEDEETGNGWMKWAGIGAGVVALFVGYKVYRKRKQQREDAELDE